MNDLSQISAFSNIFTRLKFPFLLLSNKKRCVKNLVGYLFHADLLAKTVAKLSSQVLVPQPSQNIAILLF